VGQAVTPEEIENTTFSTTLRGYNKEEVDDFLQNAAEGIRAALRDASERAYQNLGEEMGNLLQHAKDSADDLVRGAEEEAAGVREDARLDAARMRQEAETDASRIRHEAEHDATETRATAERDAAKRISEAEQRVAQLGEAEEEVRRRVSALGSELTGLTDHLHQLESAGEGGPVAEAAESDLDADTGGDEIHLDRTEEPAR
jgi:cell division initiation protein